MSRVCTICKHPERASIEKQIVSGTSYRNIASQFSVGYTAVKRHITSHIRQAVQQAHADESKALALDVITQLREVNETTHEILKQEKDAGNNGMVLYAIDRILKQLELQAKISGAIDSPQVNIYLSSEWLAIRNAIMQALSPYQEARIAVAAALASMPGGGVECAHN